VWNSLSIPGDSGEGEGVVCRRPGFPQKTASGKEPAEIDTAPIETLNTCRSAIRQELFVVSERFIKIKVRAVVE
jgi:hypothetical protein